MAHAVKLLETSVTRLSDAVAADDRPGVVAEIEVLVDMAVPMIAEGITDALAAVLPKLQKVFGTTLVGSGDVDRDDSVVGRIATPVTIFGVAASRPAREPLRKVAEEPVAAALLRAAAQSEEPLSNQVLAEKAGYTEETVARTLPKLRNLGLFEVERDWKRKLNRITEAGLAFVPSKVSARPGFDFEALVIEALSSQPKALDVRRVAGTFGAQVVESLDKHASGHVVQTGRADGAPSYKVTVLATEGEARKRYTVAHEVAHVVLHPELVQTGAHRLPPGSLVENKAIEREADRMAAAILMPEISVLRAVQSRPTLRQLADTFKVTEDAMKVRTLQLGVSKKLAA
ncbi:ImmA/IrrE family metallo-endopeptidase [Roseomonas sp. 18066]|uniref:ImmA/IrrE family metallo-endopeptidase n=1 Tax=Roseomonas sp. 18066 TaxID=2681412 RepID=UPI001357BE39|nr:ImmA/IrrE family metallo-endopeptidase [Roseomonas sp. 18066]